MLEPALQVPGFPWEEALGAWQRPAEKRALRHVGCPGGGGGQDGLDAPGTSRGEVPVTQPQGTQGLAQGGTSRKAEKSW